MWWFQERKTCVTCWLSSAWITVTLRRNQSQKSTNQIQKATTVKLPAANSKSDFLLCWFWMQREFLVAVGGGDDHSQSLKNQKTTRWKLSRVQRPEIPRNGVKSVCLFNFCLELLAPRQSLEWEWLSLHSTVTRTPSPWRSCPTSRSPAEGRRNSTPATLESNPAGTEFTERKVRWRL